MDHEYKSSVAVATRLLFHTNDLRSANYWPMGKEFNSMEAAGAWIERERKARGWSGERLASDARQLAHEAGHVMKLTQQSIDLFEKKGAKRQPSWLPYVLAALDFGQRSHADSGERLVHLPVSLPSVERLAAAIRPLIDAEPDADALATTLAERLPGLISSALSEALVAHPADRPKSRRQGQTKRGSA